MSAGLLRPAQEVDHVVVAEAAIAALADPEERAARRGRPRRLTVFTCRCSISATSAAVEQLPDLVRHHRLAVRSSSWARVAVTVRTGRWCGGCGSWPDSKVAVLSGPPGTFRSAPGVLPFMPPTVASLTTSVGCSTSVPRRARSAKDWARADALRDRIASTGLGGPGRRSRLHRAADPRPRARRPPISLEGPATVEASVQLAAEDHPDDLARAAARARRPSAVRRPGSS